MQFFATVAVTGLVMLPWLGKPGPGPEIGTPAPAFTLVDVHGKTHALSDYRGKVVVIEWVNVTCPDARLNYQSGNIPTIQKQYKAKGVVWLSIIVTQRQQSEDGKDVITLTRADSMAHAMTEQYGASPTATLIDIGGTVAAAYDTRTSLHMFVVNKKGVLAYDGALDDLSATKAYIKKLYPNFFGDEGENDKGRKSENYVVDAVKELLAGKPVTTTKVMPYGCHPVGDHQDVSGAHAGTAMAPVRDTGD